MSKFIVPGLFPSARSLTLTAGLQCLDARPDLGLRARIQVELQQPLVGADGGRGLVEGVGGLRESEQRLLVLRLELGDLLVRRDRPARGGLVPRDGSLVDAARLRRRGRCEGVLPDRLAKLARRREKLATRPDLRHLQLGELRLLERVVRLSELEIAEMAEGHSVLRTELAVLEPGRDRIVRPALVLVRLRQLLAGLRVERPLRDVLLRGRDRRPRRAAVAERVAHELPQVEAARPDAEEDEAAREDDDQEHERPLRLAAQAREEHRALGYARGTA